MPRSLVEHLADLPDPRRARGRNYPLVGLIQLTVVALLAGNTTLVAIAHFGRTRGAALGHALGFRNGQMPCANTFANLFRALDADRLDAILGAWLLEQDALGTAPIAIDGQVLRGSKDGDAPGLHLLAAYVPQAAAVIAQMPVGAKTNEHKTALRLLGLLPPLGGRLVTADAMFTHRDFAQKVRDNGGHDLLYAKDNQADTRTEIAYNFDAARYGPFPPSLQNQWNDDTRTATTHSPKSHGRRETRTLTVTTWSADRLRAMGWPDVQQVFELERVRQVKGKVATREVVYGFTSRSPQQASPAELLAGSRGHWGIENELHGVRDGTLAEDRCRVRKGSSPRVLASLRNVAVHVLTNQVRSKTCRNRAEACRHNHAQPEVPLRFLTQK